MKIIKSKFIFLLFSVLLLIKFEALRQIDTRLISQDFKKLIISLNSSSDFYLHNIGTKWNVDLREAIVPNYKIESPVIRSIVLILSFLPIVIIFDKRKKINSMLIIHFEGGKYKDIISFS